MVQRFLMGVGLIALLAGILAGLFFFSGGFNVAATSEHWGITRWALTTVRDQSIQNRKPDHVMADVDDLEALRLAAGHYANVCENCHSAPGRPPSAIGDSLTPEPPYFPALARDNTPEELFWVVKHGIKMTAMPSWPAQQRDDEVLYMVALLERLPGMAPEEYRRLAYGADPRPGAPGLIARCAQCHGIEGNGRPLKNLPVLSQQKANYLSNALQAFRSGERHSGIMQVMASELTDDDIRQLAEYFAAAPRAMTLPSPVDPLFEHGRELARTGSDDERVPPCSTCHGPKAERENPSIPDLRGQPADYIRNQLRLFREGRRGGSENRNQMRPVARSLTDGEIDAVARYYSALSPGG